jgi:PAS domain S-box-containing protein
MNILSITSMTAVIASVFLGSVVLGHNPRNRQSQLFFWLCLAAGYYALFAFGIYTATNRETAALWLRAGEAWPVFISLLMHFCLVFTEKKHMPGRTQVLVMTYLLPAPIFALLCEGSFIRAELAKESWGWSYSTQSSPAHTTYLIMISAMALAAISLCLHHWWRTRDRRKRHQARLIVVGLFIPVFVGLLTDGFMPHFGIKGPSLTNLAVVVGFAFIGLAIWRYGFFVLNPAAAAQSIIDTIPDALLLIDGTRNIAKVNPAVTTLLGYTHDELIGTPLAALLEDTTLHQWAQEPTREIHKIGSTLRRKDGSMIQVALSLSPIQQSDGSILGTVCVGHDLTIEKKLDHERMNLEQQLFQSRKLEAIGQLAGGIAHDFNNMLGGITGFGELIVLKNAAGDPLTRKYAQTIVDIAQRAADLTRQLLTFARKGTQSTETVNLNDIVADIQKITSHTFDRRIKIIGDLCTQSPTVCGDRSLLQNALLNLAVNARDAMPRGGELTFRTRALFLDRHAPHVVSGHLASGAYVILSVSDTGTGMDEKTRAHLFEPFFTTKEVGKGTGLGLSSVYGTIQSHHGYIEAHSREGQGTTFTLYLPLGTNPPEKPALEKKVHFAPGTRTVLVIDDDEAVRIILQEMLKDMGILMIAAQNGREGAAIFSKHHDRIDAVILDIIMPEVNGYDCCIELRKIDPAVRVIVSSGTVQPGVVQNMAGAVTFLQKPFDTARLVDALAAAI